MTGDRETYFAAPDRAEYEHLAQQVRQSLEDPCIKVVLEAVSGYVMILNEHRQIVAANQELLDALARDNPGCLVGLRPGEAFNCEHFTEGPGGCGTSEHCRSCGAVLAILASHSGGSPATDHCRLSAIKDGRVDTIDFQVRATPLPIGGHALTAFVLHDISSLKQREALEQTFLHDVLNTIGGIEGWSALLGEIDQVGAAREILALSASLKEEVIAQRTLLDAERGALVTRIKNCDASEVLARLRVVFEFHPVAAGKRLEIAPAPGTAPFATDQALLLRVLVNMVKNALEATDDGGTVRAWFEQRESRPAFVVENAGEIPSGVQGRVFQRSFSTRPEPGRGTGAYSMKLYGERFLGGTVSFTTGEGRTIFSIVLPAREVPPPAVAPESSAAAGNRLLLVDDEEPLLRLGGLFLTRLGYSVTACRGAAEALAMIETREFDLVITDQAMPEMTGVELCETLARIRPGLPVFLCTGFSPDAVADEGVPPAVRGVIAKPFTLESLARVLASRAPGNA